MFNKRIVLYLSKFSQYSNVQLAYQKNPAEDAVEKVLEEFTAEKAISGFLRNRPSDRLDGEGIDFLIFLNNELSLALQVKSDGGRFGYNEKFREHRRKHPLVKNLICVPIRLLPSDPDACIEK